MKNLYLLFACFLPSLALADGKAVFIQVCASCHLQGVNGAPKLGSRSDWAYRIKEGKVDLISEAYGGVRLMPAKEGKSDLSPEDFSAAVIYMANQAGADWKALNQTEHQKIARKLEKSRQQHR
ncbi:MAG: c-type cytochrome [Sulfuritalea sp.]|nr:c-type cytochrome [Sulfuritalea sp.]